MHSLTGITAIAWKKTIVLNEMLLFVDVFVVHGVSFFCYLSSWCYYYCCYYCNYLWLRRVLDSSCSQKKKKVEYSLYRNHHHKLWSAWVHLDQKKSNWHMKVTYCCWRLLYSHLHRFHGFVPSLWTAEAHLALDQAEEL